MQRSCSPFTSAETGLVESCSQWLQKKSLTSLEVDQIVTVLQGSILSVELSDYRVNDPILRILSKLMVVTQNSANHEKVRALAIRISEECSKFPHDVVFTTQDNGRLSVSSLAFFLRSKVMGGLLSKEMGAGERFLRDYPINSQMSGIEISVGDVSGSILSAYYGWITTGELKMSPEAGPEDVQSLIDLIKRFDVRGSLTGSQAKALEAVIIERINDETAIEWYSFAQLHGFKGVYVACEKVILEHLDSVEAVLEFDQQIKELAESETFKPLLLSLYRQLTPMEALENCNEQQLKKLYQIFSEVPKHRQACLKVLLKNLDMSQLKEYLSKPESFPDKTFLKEDVREVCGDLFLGLVPDWFNSLGEWKEKGDQIKPETSLFKPNNRARKEALQHLQAFVSISSLIKSVRGSYLNQLEEKALKWVLKHLPSNCKVLNLEGCQTERLDSLSRFSLLEELSLKNSTIQDLALVIFPEMREMDLSGCKRIEKVEALQKFQKLHWLNLEGCESLHHLGLTSQIRTLRWINICGTPIEQQAEKHLNRSEEADRKLK